MLEAEGEEGKEAVAEAAAAEAAALGECSILALQAFWVPAKVSGQHRVPGSERLSACLQSP